MRKKILVIDDDPILVRLLKKRLTAVGYDVLTATDGVEGYKLAREIKPDLITLDVIMPNLNGYSLCGFLKTHDSYKTIPIIMITSEKIDPLKAFDPSACPDEYFEKPLNVTDLLEKIDAMIGV